MRRWNGWGDEATDYPLPESAALYLESKIGSGNPSPDISFKQVLASVPASRLPEHPLISTAPTERVFHARGQSLPDWIAMRSGQIDAFPDGVAFPQDKQQVRDLLIYAGQTGVRLIPYGGGTSVVGHINPLPSAIPALTVDLGCMNQLIKLDEDSQLATFGAGINGPDLEAQLNPRGYTFGHFPQSWELSTLGGWIASHSSGQQSYCYGRIEDNFKGGHVETLLGPLDLPAFPASAAGPDLRHAILGSEGRLGIITQATIRIYPLPEDEHFYGVFFRDWESGSAALLQIARSHLPVSMLRLSDAQETETTLELSGKVKLVSLANTGLGLVGYGPERCLLIYGVTGSRRIVQWTRHQANAILRSHGGFPAIEMIGKIWQKSRFLTPYLRNTLWEKGYAIDTFETAVPWSKLSATTSAAKAAIQQTSEAAGEPVLVFSHLSHIYSDGASFYVTYIFRRQATPDATFSYWLANKTAASQAIVANGGTISHQHGIGTDHACYLATEKGALGMKLLQTIQNTFDPDRLLNPGKLLADADQDSAPAQKEGI